MAPEPRGSLPGPFVLSTPDHTLTADGAPGRSRPLSGGGADLAKEAEAALRDARAAGWDDPRVVGALPFRTGAPAALMAADVVRTGPRPSGAPGGGSRRGPLFRDRSPLTAGGPPSGRRPRPDPPRIPGGGSLPDPPSRERSSRTAAEAPSSGPPPRHRLREEPSADDYARLVGLAVEHLSNEGLDKVVLARTLLLDLAEPLDPGRVLARLTADNPGAFNFAVAAGAFGSGEVFGEGSGGTDGRDRDPLRRPAPVLVGASPELLVARSGRRVRSHPLAGSAPRHPDPEADRERAEALLASAKDLREHAFVVEAIAERLRPLCSRLDVPEAPSLTATATMWHLGTPLSGLLREPLPSALELAAVLHPTPAVCGTPAEAAARAIGAWEPFDRGLYAGAVGWCDADGDGEWAVTLRCAEIAGTRARLFAGAGIVADSVPAEEAAETGAKFRTMLNALGLGPVGPGSAGPDPGASGPGALDPAARVPPP
ncbi:isochorismate synthase [Nocardiopsis dassonvillei]|uniref:isochorismate synthase n=1 Tax=Nocardiopsis dassonvillei (strain ATCC 23218 / DSM 43111 / CIP 107115 / JCM 7437 / KCTC 9190 / NBRC 14626 / NCTC 10488 / NRRL B-5397 / IMRU 509) TaxID=446468 RepID=D7B178_NOCDD|nr:isochorismate synthase [Nocardiopsis dassonvillei]ADH66469.1 isochorismate synthase [Nocardiopsis dassonvillei subsp. dassonvillei DSM 43111]VEI92490.1 Isochorismate synthase dhbC [Nocardiopsis dassonvillei]